MWRRILWSSECFSVRSAGGEVVVPFALRPFAVPTPEGVARPDPCPPIPSSCATSRPTHLSFQDTRSLSSSSILSSASPPQAWFPVPHGLPCFFTLLFFLFLLPRKVPAACGCPITSPPRAVFRQTTSFNAGADSSQRVGFNAASSNCLCKRPLHFLIFPRITAINIQRRLDDRQTLGRKDSIAWF